MTDKQYDISVATQINYISEQSLPEEGRYVFAYTIKVTNTGQTAATLLRRHWLIHARRILRIYKRSNFRNSGWLYAGFL